MFIKDRYDLVLFLIPFMLLYFTYLAFLVTGEKLYRDTVFIALVSAAGALTASLVLNKARTSKRSDTSSETFHIRPECSTRRTYDEN